MIIENSYFRDLPSDLQTELRSYVEHFDVRELLVSDAGATGMLDPAGGSNFPQTGVNFFAVATVKGETRRCLGSTPLAAAGDLLHVLRQEFGPAL